MPLVSVTEYVPVISPVNTEGTQYIDTVNITGPTELWLDGDIYSTPGDYVIFQYRVFVDALNKLNTYIPTTTNIKWTNKPDRVGGAAWMNPRVNPLDPTTRQAVLRLGPAADNGTQFVENNLVFSGTPSIILDPSIFGAEGTYVLFEVLPPYTITGESLLTSRVVVFNSALKVKNIYKVQENNDQNVLVWRLYVQLGY